MRNGATPIYNRVAGVYLSSAPDATWLSRWRDPDVLIAAPIDHGALLVWEGLPTAASLRQHLDDVARATR